MAHAIARAAALTGMLFTGGLITLYAAQAGNKQLVDGLPPSDYVAQISRRPQVGHLVLALRDADVLRAPEFQHPVQCVHGNGDLSRSTLIGAEP